MVRIHPDPPSSGREPIEARGPDVYQAYTRAQATKSGEARGAVAQLGERLLCKQEVVGSIPSSSTNQHRGGAAARKQHLSVVDEVLGHRHLPWANEDEWR